MLRIEDLTVDYGNIRALHHLSLHVEQGKIVALVGCNGAGKTTLLRTLSGLVSAKSGRISFLDTNIFNGPTHKIVKLGLSQSPEGRLVFSEMSVRDNLYMGCYAFNYSKTEIEQHIEQMLHLFPKLRERLNHKAVLLSGGEQQMLAIARALMAKPKLLLLDEPSLGIAPLVVQQIFQKIIELNRTGTTILLAEQNARLALKIADRAYVLEVGHITKTGTGKALIDDVEVQRAYLGG